ncbi:MAG: hypothetical protein KDK39_02695 [Leptospiraceae bacterium]|nr:hypothetical protein [Leptospiraceae bacterium]
MPDIFLNYNLSLDEKTAIAEAFLDRYDVTEADDMYRWLWEGEFGPGQRQQVLNIEQLQQDIRQARMHYRKTGYHPGLICEESGLTRRFLRINLMVYADSGCPLNRLILLAERLRDVRPDPLRFKKDWEFMKTQIVYDMTLKIQQLRQFENRIAFHMSPETAWSDVWLERYGEGYWLVPRSLFYQYFPEYGDISYD